MTSRCQHSGRFAIIPARAIDDRRLGRAALAVLAALGTYSDRDGWCWPATSTLAQRLGTSRQAVSKQIKALVQLGYVETQRRKRPDGGDATTAYRLLFDGDMAEEYGRLKSAENQPDGEHREVAPRATPEVAGGATPEVAPIKNDPIERTLIPSFLDHQFDAFWRSYPSRRPHQNPRKPARQKFEAALRRGVRFADILRGAKNFAAYVEQERVEPKYIAQAVTWLSQERWQDHQEAPEPAPAADGGWL